MEVGVRERGAVEEEEVDVVEVEMEESVVPRMAQWSQRPMLPMCRSEATGVTENATLPTTLPSTYRSTLLPSLVRQACALAFGVIDKT